MALAAPHRSNRSARASRAAATPPHEPDDPNFVTALARGLSLLRAFGPGDALLGNQDLVARTGLPKATVNRLAGTLVRLGYLRHDAGLGKYALDVGVLALGHAYLDGHDLPALLRPHMLAFARTHEASVSLGRCDGLDMVYLESVRVERTSGLGLAAGSRLSLLSSSMGRAWLAALDERARDALLARLAAARPDAWAAQAPPMRAAVSAARRDGFALSLRDWHPAIDAVAVAWISATDGQRYVLSSSVPSGLDRDQAEARLREVLAPALLALVRRFAA